MQIYVKYAYRNINKKIFIIKYQAAFMYIKSDFIKVSNIPYLIKQNL